MVDEGDDEGDGGEEVDGEAEGATLETRLATVTVTALGVRPEGPAAMAEPDCRTTAAVVEERTVTDIQALRRRAIVDPAVSGPRGFLSTMSLSAAVAFHRSCDRNYISGQVERVLVRPDRVVLGQYDNGYCAV